MMVPRIERISRACHEMGARHFFGSDGNVWPVAEGLYRSAQIDGHYELDRRAGMRATEVHASFPMVAMVGGISSWTLHRGTSDEVRAEVQLCVQEARETGKLVAGCSNVIVSQTPDENVDALLQTLSAGA